MSATSCRQIGHKFLAVLVAVSPVTGLTISESMLTVLSGSLADSLAESLAGSLADLLELEHPYKSSKVGGTKKRKYYILIVLITITI